MKPLTLEDVERDLRAALDTGDKGLAQTLAADLERLEGRGRPPILAWSAALWYAEQGLSVFPIQPSSKLPYRGTRGVLEATTDQAQLRAWAERWPDANIAIATGHPVDVIDFDGLEGHHAWGERYGETWGGLEVLGTVSTPRPGGLHVYVEPIPGRSRNRAGLMPHVDVRGRGGYVLVPPSATELGTYRWLRPLKLSSGLP